jgi:hypothetical protein
LEKKQPEKVNFRDDAAHKLINDLRTVLVQQSDGTMERQLGLHIEPVQLQVVCRRLWEKLPEQTVEIKPRNALPKKLLSRPGGAALAFIGHIERAWGSSIASASLHNQIQPFQNAIGRILKGEPIGFAMKDFNEKYAAVSTRLSGMLEQISYGRKVSKVDLAASWVERNDAEGYLILGDPAIKLRVNDFNMNGQPAPANPS